MIPVTEQIALDEADIRVEFIRTSGPGGQNVNKVASGVQLRFDLAHSRSLPEWVRARLMRLAGKRITREGEILIDARRFRTQERNREDALDRLVEMVRQAATLPKPRRPTRPSRASRARRLESKRHRSGLKQSRQAPED